MANETNTRSGFLGFFSTLPGLITAIAALLTTLVTFGFIATSNPRGTPEDPDGPSTPPIEQVAVPNVVGWPINDAIRHLEETRLDSSVAAEESDGDVPAGHVSRQHPPGGTVVDIGTVIELWEAPEQTIPPPAPE